MRYLADECLGRLFVSGLRDRGHDVEWIRESASGIADEDVLDRSFRQDRILLTEDFDYGELVFGRGQPACGVVIIRISAFKGSWTEVVAAVLDRLETMQASMPGNLTVVDASGIRSRPLPVS